MLGDLAATAMTGVAFLVNGAVTVAAGVLQHRGTPGWLLIVTASVVFVPCLWLIYTVPLPLAAATAVTCAFSGCGGLIASANMRAIARHAASPSDAGDGVAAMTQFINVGQLVGPPLIGLVAASGGSWRVALLLMLPTLTILLCGLWLKHLDHRRTIRSTRDSDRRSRGTAG
ncbi:MFS transporter [Saccharopolyspora sp. 5N102]|uniref:MFS transporter n=1 Tax=Saccharopolyspora sp. 5N102 TaxID=3375155 RepID=UPI0037938FCF